MTASTSRAPMVRLSLLALILLVALMLGPVLSDSASSSHSYYDLLEVSPTDTEKAIKKSYRRLALVHHPDKASSESERVAKEAVFVHLANAVEVLTSDVLRPRYDYLLTQKVYDYDDKAYDWSLFNPQTGQFESTEISFGDGRFSFRSTPTSFAEARKRFEREKEEEEKEARALIMALLCSAAVALLPVGYYYYQRLAVAQADKRRKAEASERLRDKQSLVNQLNAERTAEEERVRRENTVRARELRQERERMLTEAESGDEDDGEDESETNTAEPVDGIDDTPQPPAEAADVEDSEDDERSRHSARATAAIFSCALCRKKFKSSQQYEQHLQSNQHKKAEKAKR